ncbi:Ig-like domain-containing protein [Vibrio sp. SCSIO 43135]|nr:Ig-like domain-containing protein [Vibrio sp. SCSIO 43135]
MLLYLKRQYIYALVGLSLFGCNSDDGSVQEPVSVYVPYDIRELPKPNDGYGYDDDNTIRGVNEPSGYSASDQHPYYQDYNNSYAALDGWGLCAEPILIPLQSADSEKRFPLDPDSLDGNVALYDEDGDIVPTQISADGSTIKIQCEQSLQPATTYSVVVTDGVRTDFNQPLQADASFLNLISASEGDLDDEQKELQQQVFAAMNHHGSSAGFVYAAQFTTQSSYSALDAMRDNHIANTTIFNAVPLKDSKNRKYNLFTYTLNAPFYLPFTEAREEECLIDEFDPKPACPPLYEWMTTDQDGFPTFNDPLPQVVEMQDIEVNVYAPKENDMNTPMPVVIFVHGVTGQKDDASLMAADYTSEGIAVVSIDMPYHGSRIRHDDNGVEISARANKSFFINIDSPLALRSNLQQSVSDFLGLRYALNSLPWVKNDDVHLVGLSLGGIMSVMITEFTQNNPAFSLKTANFVVPGQGLTNLTLSSKTLGPEMSEAVKKSPDVQRSIAETVIPNTCTASASNQECIEALRDFVDVSEENAITVTQLENDIYTLIEPGLLQGVQSTIDSSDPASFTRDQRWYKQPTLLIEAVGNCGETCEVGEYMPDTVVPNSAPNNIRTGTDPLIKALDLEPLVDTYNIQPHTRGVIRATTGGHGTYLFPYEGPMDETGLPSFPEGETMKFVMDANVTQKIAVRSMVRSDSHAVRIKNIEHIETEVPSDEE